MQTVEYQMDLFSDFDDEIQTEIIEQEKKSSKKKEYSLVVRSQHGGGWCPISSTSDLEKAKKAAIKLHENGGYSIVQSEFCIGGIPYCDIRQVEFFIGSKDVFKKYDSYGRSFDEYLRDLKNFNNDSRREYGRILQEKQGEF